MKKLALAAFSSTLILIGIIVWMVNTQPTVANAGGGEQGQFVISLEYARVDTIIDMITRTYKSHIELSTSPDKFVWQEEWFGQRWLIQYPHTIQAGSYYTQENPIDGTGEKPVLTAFALRPSQLEAPFFASEWIALNCAPTPRIYWAYIPSRGGIDVTIYNYGPNYDGIHRYFTKDGGQTWEDLVPGQVYSALFPFQGKVAVSNTKDPSGWNDCLRFSWNATKILVGEPPTSTIPQIANVHSGFNQVSVEGDNLWATNDKDQDIVLTFTRKSDGKIFEFKGGYQPRSYGFEIAGYGDRFISLRTGFLPSVFEGTVQLSTTRGKSNVFDFTINDTSCKSNIAGIASLLGGNDSEWKSTGQGQWTFTRNTTVWLFSPYTGKLTVNGIATEQGKFWSIPSNAVYECGTTQPFSVATVIFLPVVLKQKG